MVACFSSRLILLLLGGCAMGSVIPSVEKLSNAGGQCSFLPEPQRNSALSSAAQCSALIQIGKESSQPVGSQRFLRQQLQIAIKENGTACLNRVDSSSSIQSSTQLSITLSAALHHIGIKLSKRAVNLKAFISDIVTADESTKFQFCTSGWRPDGVDSMLQVTIHYCDAIYDLHGLQYRTIYSTSADPCVTLIQTSSLLDSLVNLTVSLNGSRWMESHSIGSTLPQQSSTVTSAPFGVDFIQSKDNGAQVYLQQNLLLWQPLDSQQQPQWIAADAFSTVAQEDVRGSFVTSLLTHFFQFAPPLQTPH